MNSPQVFKTAQVAETLECSAGTIRSIKSRNSEEFQEGRDYVKDGNELLWTETGMAALARLMGKTAPLPVADLQQAAIAHVDDIALTAATQILDAALVGRMLQILRNPDEAQRSHLQAHIDDKIEALVAACIGLDAFSFIAAESKKRLESFKSV